MPKETLSEIYAAKEPAEVFSPEGLFWLEPGIIGDVDTLINNTHLPTMAIGAGTRSEEMSAARGELKDILISSDDPLAAELERALDIGFMYGSLIAEKTRSLYLDKGQESEKAAADDLPALLRDGVSAAVAGIEPDSPEGSHILFMRLRDLEAAYAHSDVLAFSLAATQDHMQTEFTEYHKPEKDLAPGETRRLQSLYYAGALVGGLMHSDASNLGKPPIHIVRAMQGPAESVGMRLEFEPDDDIVETIDGALSSKLFFTYVDQPDESPYLAVTASGFQYGPNTISLPLFMPGMEEPRLMKKVPIDEVESLIIREIDEETGEYGDFGLVTDLDRYLAESPASKIVGLALRDGPCIAAYDRAHPNASIVWKLAAVARGIEVGRMPYSSGIETATPASKFIGRAALTAGLAAPWVLDAVAELTGAGEPHWSQDAVVDLLIIAGYAGLKMARRSLGKQERQSDANYQTLLDQMAGYR